MTVSEIHFESPSDRLSNIHDEDAEEQNDLLRQLSDEIEKSERKSEEQDDLPSQSQQMSSPMPQAKQKRSNTGSDRRRFKGVLSDMIYRTKKDNYVRDG